MSPAFRHDQGGTPAEAWRGHERYAGLRRVDADTLCGPGTDRVVVVAAHPDDETLGTAGLLAGLFARPGAGPDRGRVAVHVVLLSAGEASHPDSPTLPPHRLAGVRLEESRAALDVVAPHATCECWSLPDGHLAEHRREALHRLVEVLGDARRTLLLAPWRHDGHPDHEAAGEVAAAAARRCGARLAEYPVWWWHWSTPDRLPGHEHAEWVRHDLSEPAAAAKREAVARHRTQVAPLSDRPGDETLLTPGFLAHFERTEVFVLGPVGDAALDDLHRQVAEPWDAAESWYERRKRALLLAMLPAEDLGRTLEVGCSTGHLTAALAERSRSLVALDESEAAVAAARTRLPAAVDVRHAAVPEDWPQQDFDTVVLSEVGYFLSHAGLDAVLDRVEQTLAPDGVLLLGHWRHPIEGWPLDGPDVHARVEADGRWEVTHRYADADVEVLLLRGR